MPWLVPFPGSRQPPRRPCLLIQDPFSIPRSLEMNGIVSEPFQGVKSSWTRGQKSEVGGRKISDRNQRSGTKNGPGFLIMLPSILPICRERSLSSLWHSAVMYSQSFAKSKAESVSLFSPSQSVSLLTKWASYRLLAHASRRFRQMDRDERLI